MCRAISEATNRVSFFLDPAVMVTRLNRMLVGWANYFCLGQVWTAYRSLDRHACFRLRQWLGRKFKVQQTERTRFSEPYLRRLGLVRLEGRPRQFSWAKA